MAATTTMEAQLERPKHSHFSHQHPLDTANAAITANCSGCTLQILGGRDYYTCRPCSFFLHSACFKMPSSLLHPADTNHHLTLLHHASTSTSVLCRACALPLGGSGFSYHCSDCHVHYHSLCLFRPISKNHPPLHHHQLNLSFSSPYGPSEGFRCDVCGNPGLPDQWLYRCDPCGFDSHVDCSSATTTTPTPTTTSRAPLSAPAPAPPPLGYPPVGYGATTAMTNAQQQQQQQQQQVGSGFVGPTSAGSFGQTQQQFGGGAMYPVTVQQQQPPPHMVVGGGYVPAGGGYPVNYGQQPIMMGVGGGGGGQMGMGSLVMTSAVAGATQGVAGGLVQTAFDGGFGNHDGSASSNHMEY